MGMEKYRWNTEGEIKAHCVISQSISYVCGSLIPNFIGPKLECADFLCDEVKRHGKTERQNQTYCIVLEGLSQSFDSVITNSIWGEVECVEFLSHGMNVRTWRFDWGCFTGWCLIAQARSWMPLCLIRFACRFNVVVVYVKMWVYLWRNRGSSWIHHVVSQSFREIWHPRVRYLHVHEICCWVFLLRAYKWIVAKHKNGL